MNSISLVSKESNGSVILVAILFFVCHFSSLDASVLNGDCVNASSRFHRRHELSFQKDDLLCNSAVVFFPIFLRRRGVYARAHIPLWKVEVSAYYLATYVEKRPYRSPPRCRSATISCSVSMRVKRVVSRKPSRSRIQFAFH